MNLAKPVDDVRLEIMNRESPHKSDSAVSQTINTVSLNEAIDQPFGFPPDERDAMHPTDCSSTLDTMPKISLYLDGVVRTTEPLKVCLDDDTSIEDGDDDMFDDEDFYFGDEDFQALLSRETKGKRVLTTPIAPQLSQGGSASACPTPFPQSSHPPLHHGASFFPTANAACSSETNVCAESTSSSAADSSSSGEAHHAFFLDLYIRTYVLFYDHLRLSTHVELY